MVCLSLSSACLDATTIPHASGAWCRIFHLMQVCCLPWCPGRPVLCVLRAWLLGVCVSLALLCALPPGLPVSLWPGAVGLCSALLPGVWACYACPCGLGLCVGLVYRPLISPCYMGLFCGLVFRTLYGPLKSALFLPGFFGYVFLCFFPGFVFALKFPARFSGFKGWIFFSGFFCVDFSGENFPDIFSGFYFPGFFLA